MPSKEVAAPVPKELVKVKPKLTHLVIPITTRAMKLEVTSDDDYAEADAALKTIRAALKSVAESFDPIIEPARASLNATYAFRRSFDLPLNEAEDHVRNQMKRYQLAEQKRIADEEYEKEKTRRRLLEEAEETQRKADAAKRPQEAAKLEKKAERLVEQSQDVAAMPVQGPVKGSSSTTRKVKKWRLINLPQFLAHVVAGKASQETVTLNNIYVNQMLRDHPDVVATWPGIQVYEDVQIIGR